MALPLVVSQVFEAVEFDSPGDVGHTWLAVAAPGEIAGLLSCGGWPGRGGHGRRTAVAGPSPGRWPGPGQAGQGGKAAVMVLVAAARAWGKLIWPGGMPAASTPAPMS